MSRYYVRTNEGAYLQGHANPTPLWTNKVEDAEELDAETALEFIDKVEDTLRKNVFTYLEPVFLEPIKVKIVSDGINEFQDDIEDLKQQIYDSLFSQIETDDVNHPEHYNQYTFEAIDVIDEVAPKYPVEVAMEIGNAIKYLLRAPFKGWLIQDLNKAVWYINRAIENLEKSEKYDYED